MSERERERGKEGGKTMRKDWGKKGSNRKKALIWSSFLFKSQATAMLEWLHEHCIYKHQHQQLTLKIETTVLTKVTNMISNS